MARLARMTGSGGIWPLCWMFRWRILYGLPSTSATTAARWRKAAMASRVASSSALRRVSGDGNWLTPPIASRICCNWPSSSETAAASRDSRISSEWMRQLSIFWFWP